VLLLRGSDYKSMDRKNLIQQIEENGEEDMVVEGVPVCATNLVSPVSDTAYFIEQVHYKIGTRLYIENAD
jgi:squalene cyclase